MFEILIDTGGTFTDGVLVDENQEISMAKFPTNATDPSLSVMGCIKRLCQERGLTEQEVLANTSTLVMGTTLATNSVVEGKGAKCCLLYTKGFRDVLELGRRITKENIYILKTPSIEPLIPRRLRFGIEERLQYNGETITALNKNDVQEAIRKAKEQGVEVPVIWFLHSYVNPAHEEEAAEMMKDEFPDVVISSHVLRRWIEWEQLVTAVLAASVKPAATGFVRSLEKQLKDANFKRTTLFMTCAGGVITPELSLDNPALLIGSGPTAGILMGRYWGELADFGNVITADMGGTSFDIGILPGRVITTTTETRIGDWRNALESLEVTSIGAGGGSIAWIDERGFLRVGPSSAQADPGPACYGKGGQMPTVTDANVILGYVPSDYFLGGTIQLDVSLAEKAVEEKIAKPLGLDKIAAAFAISSLVEANMAERIFLTAVKKGVDPRDFTLVVGGGAGPVHAVALAARLGIKQIYITKQAGVFCAFGMAVADYVYILSRFLYRRDDEVDANELKGYYDSLEEEGWNILTRQGITEKDMKFIRGAEMRYFGQLHDIDVLLPETRRGEPFTEQTCKTLFSSFHERHQAIYGWSDTTMPVTIASLKLRAVGMRRPLKLKKRPFSGKDASAALKRQRQVYFKELGGFTETPCYDGDRLQNGNVISGPAIIEETKTTIVVPQGAELTVDAYGNYRIFRR